MKHALVNKLLEKKMNRKEFLAHIGAGALTVIGVSGLLKNLVNYSSNNRPYREVGYGSNDYGGKRAKAGRS